MKKKSCLFLLCVMSLFLSSVQAYEYKDSAFSRKLIFLECLLLTASHYYSILTTLNGYELKPVAELFDWPEQEKETKVIMEVSGFDNKYISPFVDEEKIISGNKKSWQWMMDFPPEGIQRSWVALPLNIKLEPYQFEMNLMNGSLNSNFARIARLFEDMSSCGGKLYLHLALAAARNRADAMDLLEHLGLSKDEPPTLDGIKVLLIIMARYHGCNVFNQNTTTITTRERTDRVYKALISTITSFARRLTLPPKINKELKFLVNFLLGLADMDEKGPSNKPGKKSNTASGGNTFNNFQYGQVNVMNVINVMGFEGMPDSEYSGSEPESPVITEKPDDEFEKLDEASGGEPVGRHRAIHIGWYVTDSMSESEIDRVIIQRLNSGQHDLGGNDADHVFRELMNQHCHDRQSIFKKLDKNYRLVKKGDAYNLEK